MDPTIEVILKFISRSSITLVKIMMPSPANNQLPLTQPQALPLLPQGSPSSLPQPSLDSWVNSNLVHEARHRLCSVCKLYYCPYHFPDLCRPERIGHSVESLCHVEQLASLELGNRNGIIPVGEDEEDAIDWNWLVALVEKGQLENFVLESRATVR